MAGISLTEPIWMPDWLCLLAAFVWGALWGSFLNVVIHRLPRGESLVRPASRCPSCGHPIRFFDNVPILSWLLLGGRCRDCRAAVSPRYPLVELVGALLSLGLFARLVLHGPPEAPLATSLASYLASFSFAAVLIVVIFVDLDRQIVPNEITFGGMALGFLLSFLLPGVTWWQSLIGLVAGGSFVVLINAGYARLRGMQGMGMGDAKLLAMIGAFLGYRSLLFIALAASLLGLLAAVGFGVVRRLTGRSWHLYDPASLQEERTPTPVAGRTGEAGEQLPARAAAGEAGEQLPAGEGGAEPATPAPLELPLHRTAIAFAPYLAVAAIAYLLAGEEISEAYIQLVWWLTLQLTGG